MRIRSPSGVPWWPTCDLGVPFFAEKSGPRRRAASGTDSASSIGMLKPVSGWGLVMVLLAASARADTPAVDVTSLARSGRAQRYDLALGGASIRAGGAAIVV